MQQDIHDIVIVGGGTAGWITACRLAAAHGRSATRRVDVTLIESPDIPTIGVGEGTWPSMRMTLQSVGISEADLLRTSDASFKQGTQFRGWSGAGGPAVYYHPFSLPAEYSSLNLADYWTALDTDVAFADFVSPQGRVIAAGLAPKQVSTPEYAFNVNYGYHFDAAKFAGLLHRHAVNELGVRYRSDNVVRVVPRPDGDIGSLLLQSGDEVAGDLFIDCTGPRSLLTGRHYGIEFVPVRDVLFNDAAIAVQVPYVKSDERIASATRATAVSSGWIWDIGLQSRRGIGHVYSSAHCDESDAIASLREYVASVSPATRLDDLAFRTIPFEPGYRRRFWNRNCVAVGLSGGFIEPLEASALALIEQAADIICRQLPVNREIMDVVAGRFNAKMRYHWERVVEFLKLHYAVSRRDDSDYWIAHREPSSWPPALREKLTLWNQQAPWHDDAPRVDELFPSASYQYVLYGMGFRPKYPKDAAPTPGRATKRVDAILHANNEKARQMLSLLPTNRELVNATLAMTDVA